MSKNRPVSGKAKAGSLAALVASFVVAWVVYKAPFMSGLADPLQAAITGLVTSTVAFVSAWLARHQPPPAR